ncbi:outer membrane protein [Pelagibacterium montanilacus]|uniref:outer membrane protein n=1 Tax=Pelagibacterium montanilacus TaxID=2185280 RepID=UPI000F8E537E|nr:outer membrane protein [Pelagibacterium montanilacus]
MTALKTTLLATAAVFALGTAAQAADAIMPAPAPIAPAPVMSHDWSGFYAGINAGFGSGELYGDDVDDFETAIGDEFNDVSGFLGGVQGGANFQTGMFVLGVEGDIQLTTMSQSIEGIDITTPVAFEGDADFNLDYFGTVRARAGLALDNVMPYLTAGLAYGGGTFSYDGDDGLLVPASVDGSTSAHHTGWTVGGGVEVAMDESVSFKAEYLYTDLGEATYETDDFDDIEAGLQFHTIRAGVNFHF